MKAAVCVISLAIAAWIPSVSASIPPRFGSELNPEVTDPPGDVFYEPTYVGEQNRKHLDVLAGWFEYVPEVDAFSANIKVASLAGIQDGVDTYEWAACRFEIPGTVDGELAGQFVFSFRIEADGDQFPAAHFTREGASASVDLKHSVDVRWTEPGYISIIVARTLIQDQATAMEGNAYVGCSEFRGYPTSNAPLFAAENFDSAEASAKFIVAESRKGASAGGNEEDFPWITAEDSPSPSPPDTNNTAAESITMAAIAIGLAAGLLRRRQ